MAGIKISALPALPSAAGTDLYATVQGGVTYKGTVSQLATFFNSNLTYLPLAGGTMLGDINMGGFKATNAAEPTAAQDYATKHYVDTTALNGTTVYAASAASLGTVTQSGAGVGATLTNAGVQATFALDGVNPPVGSNVLIKNTAAGMTAANEGIYTVTSVGSGATNWVLTRATSYDTPTEINNTGLIVIQNGSTLAGTAWYNAATIVTVDTTNFSYSQFGNIIFPVSVSQGGTGATTFTAYGVLTGGTTATGALQSVTPGASGTILRSGGASALPAWSTTTYPATNAINTLLYASSANVMSALATANSSVLVTDSSGVPSLSSTLPAFTTSSITFNPTTGGIVGTTTNDNVAALKVGEYVTATSVGSPVSITTDTAKTVTSISLTAGDWDIGGMVGFIAAASTIIATGVGGASLTDNTLPAQDQYFVFYPPNTVALVPSAHIPTRRISIAATTTIYLVAQATFSVSTCTAYGMLWGRRRR